MDVPAMKVTLAGVLATRGQWSLTAEGVFEKGVHLVSGDVGSGKSTLALLLAGMFPPSSGTVHREGIASTMITFQFPEYHITGQDVKSEIRSWGLDPDIILAAAGLTQQKGRDPLDMSRGELKRMVLACVFASDYDLLILDEPFSSLDCIEKDRLCSSLSGRKKGITIIFSHEKAYFPKIDRIWEIQEGILYDRGQLPEALGRWEHAPAVVKTLVAKGRIPANISRADLMEAACRT